MAFEPVPEDVEQVATVVIGAAIEVHKHLGPGFIERIYHEALGEELRLRQIPYERERAVVVNYKRLAISGQRIEGGHQTHGRVITRTFDLRVLSVLCAISS